MTPLIHRNIAVGTLAIAAATMPFSVRLCHWSLLAFVLNWVVEANFKDKATMLGHNKLWWLMPSYFALCLAGMFYTETSAQGWQQIERKAAFFLLPLTLASTAQLGRAHLILIFQVFVLACLAATLFSIGHSAWMAYGGSIGHNFSAETLDEFHKLNPNSSPLWLAFSYVSLASGVSLHPTYFGLYLALCMLSVLYFFREGERLSIESPAGKVLFIFFFIFILFLSSRITILIAIMIVLSAFALPPRAISRPGFRALPVVMVILAALIVYVNPVSRFRGLQEPTTASVPQSPSHTISSIDIRLSLLQLSSHASMAANPLFGSGTGGAEERLRIQGSALGMTNILGTYDPHNQYVYTFLELGIVGLGVLLSMIFVPLLFAIKRGSKLHAGMLLAVSTVCLTESVFELQKGIVLFTFFGSLLMFHEGNFEDKPHRHG